MVSLGDVLWRRLDESSLDHCCFRAAAGYYSVNGCVLTLMNGKPCRIQYVVQCDLDWTTRAAHIQLIGSDLRGFMIRRDEAGVWWRDNEPIPGADGVLDVDIAITPATNTLPIRRLALEVGSSAAVDAAWIRFPDLSLERLPQRYTRTAERRYVYESGGGAFTADLEVDEEGIVMRYGDIWERVTS